MSNIRSALAAGLFVIGGAVVASAQQTAPPLPQSQAAHGQHVKGERGPGRRGGRGELMKGLSLSPTEKANVKSVHGKYAAQLKALRPQVKGQKPTDAQRDQAKQLMAAERNDLRVALSPANQSKFDANTAEFEKRMAARAQKKGHRPGVV
jgi:Spy/CpxP family protein refolding chaperone